MKAKDLMITDVISAKENDTIKDVMQSMVCHKIGGVPVVNENGILIGVVSDGDILRNLNPHKPLVCGWGVYVFCYERPELQDVIESEINQNILTIAKKKGIVTVHPEDSMEKVLSTFANHRFKKIPVLDDQKKVVGVISRGDLIRSIQEKVMHKVS